MLAVWRWSLCFVYCVCVVYSLCVSILCIARRVLFVICSVMYVVVCWLLFACCCFGIRWLLFVGFVMCSSCDVCCLLFGVCCLLYVVCRCLLFVGGCLLCVVVSC